MEDEKTNIPDEILTNLSIDEIVELKLEVDDVEAKLNDIINQCNETLNLE